MKRIVVFTLLILFSLNLFCEEIDYTKMPVDTLPEFSGELNDPDVKIVAMDSSETCVIVINKGKVYVFYL